MAKFYDLHLLLQEDMRILFGDDSLGKDGPAVYPATNLGSEKAFIGYTTISGYNTTYPGSGITTIASTAQLAVSTPLAGERATQPYHLARFDQLQDVVDDASNSDWQESVLSFESDPPGAPANGERYIVEATASGVWAGQENNIVEWNTASGTWDVYNPNEGFTTFVEDEDKYYVYYNGNWAPMGEGIDHGDLIGLEDDDHTQYVPTTGDRGFTSTVSGTYPVSGYDLVTKDYVDEIIAAISGTTTIISGVIYIDHSATTNRDVADSHPADAISVDTTNFDGILSGLDTDVQTALDTIDDALTSSANFVTISGTPQTITGDKTFDGTLTTFLNGVFFDGITITMSGTTLNTESAAVFNYDSTATINNDGDNNFTSNSTTNHENGSTDTYEGGAETIHESGSNDTYNDGSNLTYSGTTITNTGDTNTINGANTTETNYGDVNNANGSTITNEGGSTTNYDDNSTINNSGDTIYDSTANITASGTNIDYQDGTTVNYEDGTVETYEGGSETFHNSLSEDTYLPGSILTFSGTDVNFEGDTDINYGPSTTTVNEGDTTFVAGSTVTFSGTTNFDSEVNLNENMWFGGNTISGTGDIFAGNLTVENLVDESKKWGREAMIDGVRQQAVTFTTAFPSDDYTVITSITNELDSPPSIYSAIVGAKSTTGFVVYFSGKIDSSNYELEWHANEATYNV